MTHESRTDIYSMDPATGEIQALASLQTASIEIASLESDLDNIRIVLQNQASRIKELEDIVYDYRAKLSELNSPEIERDSVDLQKGGANRLRQRPETTTIS